MKTNIVRKPEGANRDKKVDQMVIRALADDEAIVSVSQEDGGDSLCLTDKNGRKLYVIIKENHADFSESLPATATVVCKPNRVPAAYNVIQKTCPCNWCGCVYLDWGSLRGYFYPNTFKLCDHHR